MSYNDIIIRLPPFHYLHLLDTNKNVTRVEVGPQTLTALDHEKVVLAPEKMITIPPRHYCIIENPVVKIGEQVQLEKSGQAKLRHGDREVRLEQEPFPLYPGEKLVGKISPLQVVPPNSALRLRSTRDFEDRYNKDKNGKARRRAAGEEWLFEGPATYIPQVEVDVVEKVDAIILQADQALKLKARRDCVGRDGVNHLAGEEWIVRSEGAFLPGVDEVVVQVIKSHILTDKKALHLRATKTFVDELGKTRKAGDEWLVTRQDHELHTPHVYEEVVGEQNLLTLTASQYCVINDPVVDGKNQLGKRKIVKGPHSLFLLPGESLDTSDGASIKQVYVLAPDEALHVRAKLAFEDNGTKRNPGNKWFVYGPQAYIPPVEADVLGIKRAIIALEGMNYYVFEASSILGVFLMFMALLYMYFKYVRA